MTAEFSILRTVSGFADDLPSNPENTMSENWRSTTGRQFGVVSLVPDCVHASDFSGSVSTQKQHRLDENGA